MLTLAYIVRWHDSGGMRSATFANPLEAHMEFDALKVKGVNALDLVAIDETLLRSEHGLTPKPAEPVEPAKAEDRCPHVGDFVHYVIAGGFHQLGLVVKCPGPGPRVVDLVVFSNEPPIHWYYRVLYDVPGVRVFCSDTWHWPEEERGGKQC